MTQRTIPSFVLPLTIMAAIVSVSTGMMPSCASELHPNQNGSIIPQSACEDTDGCSKAQSRVNYFLTQGAPAIARHDQYYEFQKRILLAFRKRWLKAGQKADVGLCFNVSNTKKIGSIEVCHSGGKKADKVAKAILLTIAIPPIPSSLSSEEVIPVVFNTGCLRKIDAAPLRDYSPPPTHGGHAW